MSSLANSFDKLRLGILHQWNIHDFRTAILGVWTSAKVKTALTRAIAWPTNLHSYKALSILWLGDSINQIPDSPLFYDKAELGRLLNTVDKYPETYGAGTLDRYWNEYVKSHENPKSKWGLRDIIAEVFSGIMIHEWPISIGKVTVWKDRYLFIGHDKNYNQGRASTEDHRAVLDILKQENHSEYDKVAFFVDTPGADSGRQANETHQAATMSELISTVSTLNKPTLTILTGEGGSGGAEVLFGTDYRIALSNTCFSTIHPIGQSAILKWRYSPKEIAYLLAIDAPHLYGKWIIDAISKISITKSTSASTIKQQLEEILHASFQLINKNVHAWVAWTEYEQRLFNRGLRLRGQTANMLNSRIGEIKKSQTAINSFPKYHMHDVMANFDAKIKWDTDIHTRILDFFVAEFDNSNLTKFNILAAIDTLIEHVWNKVYTSQLNPKNRNEIVGSIREELYHYQAFFSTLSVLIDPKNYDKFFSTSGTHVDRMISSEQWWLSYEKIQIEKFLREIFDSIDPKNTHSSYETWKQSHFSWLSSIMTDQREVVIELTKKFKQVHYDLPDTIVSLALLLEQKFIESIFDPNFSPILLSSDTLPIDFHAKAIYELIRFYEWLRSQIFGKRGIEEIQRKFLSSYTEMHQHFERAHTTALQDPKKLREKPQSSVSVGWGRIGYDLERSTGIERREIDQQFGVIMLDFWVEWWAIDGAAAANIVQLIEQATRDEKPIVMFLQSAGMYVDGGPEAVSSMTAINFTIAEYFRKTAGNPKCQIFSVPFGICTGGTIASFAQAPGVIVLPLSLSDIPFAGRIVTMDQLPLSATLADLQIGKWKIAWIASNPFISENVAASIYAGLRARGISVEIPEKDLLAYIAEYLNIPLNAPVSVSESNWVREYSNAELFRPIERGVAILNRGVIASKAIGVLENMKKPYLAFATAADKDLSYIQKASKKWNVTFVNDYMMSELAIIQAIKDGGCDAVYLGYGFWSERDSFIRMCQDHGIVVIGPSANNVKQMWDKIQARTTFKNVLETVESDEEERIKYAPARWSDDVLGGEWIITTTEQAIQVANQIGYPVMIKAVYGGGGKWIRKVNSDQDLRNSFDLMSREATESFWNGAMYMEKALENQRHIEVQIFSDIHGNAISLGVRDCTTQRNRQKVIEETGSLGIEQHLLTRLQDIAVAVVRQIGYVGAGTFEFLYDPVKEVFTFMEMNTRIQVEHTITEKYLRETLDKDINLVNLQFQVAQWWTDKILDPKHRENLSNAIQEKKKHVMEVRICAEDPANNFAWVSMAKIKNWSLDLPRNLRKYVQFETFLSHETGVNHTSKYDSMIGQLIVTGNNREHARMNMIEALRSLKIEWIPTNQEFALRILESDEFRDRTLRIDSMDSKPDKFFGNLKAFTEKIESISELREDSVLLEEWEYVIRMNQDAKITHVPKIWSQFTIPGSEWLFEITMNKANTVITSKEILSDSFYIKDNSGLSCNLPEWRYEIMERMTIDPKNYSRGKAILVIRPVV